MPVTSGRVEQLAALRQPRGTLVAVVAVQRREVAIRGSLKEPDAPAPESLPVDGVGQTLEVLAGLDADHALACTLSARLQALHEAPLEFAGVPVCPVRGHLLAFELSVQPRDEQEVAGAGLDGAGPGEEVLRHGVPDRADAELV